MKINGYIYEKFLVVSFPIKIGALFITVLMLQLLLVSCSNESKSARITNSLEEAIMARLNDPDSAKFKNKVFSGDGKKACIIWNAKNKMGGYGDWQIAELTLSGSQWIVKDMEGSADNCTERAFQGPIYEPPQEKVIVRVKVNNNGKKAFEAKANCERCHVKK